MSSASGKKKKGLSLEEKVVLVERWITAHPQPFTMKELQQLIPKHTPVIYQSVEECVQLLVAENRVQQDRVGVSSLFWKFPLTETQKQRPAVEQRGCGGGGVSGRGSSGGRLIYAELLRRLLCAESVPLSAAAVEGLCATVSLSELTEWHTHLLVEHVAVDRRLAMESARVGMAPEKQAEEEEETRLTSEVATLRELSTQRARLLAQSRELSSLQNLPETLRQLSHATAVAIEAADRWTDNYFLAEAEVAAKTGQSQRDVRAALQVPLNLDFVSDEEDEKEDEEDEVNGGAVSVVMGECQAADTRACIGPTPSAALPAESTVLTPPLGPREATSATHVEDVPACAVAEEKLLQEATAFCVTECAAADVSTLPAAETPAESVPSKGRGRKPAAKKRVAQKRPR